MKCRKRSSQFGKTYKGIAKTPTKQLRTMGVKFTCWTLQKLNMLILSPFPSSPTNMFTSPVAPWLPTAMRLHCVPLPAPGPPRTKTTLGPKSTCFGKVDFWSFTDLLIKMTRAQKKLVFQSGGCERKGGSAVWLQESYSFDTATCVAGEIQLSMILRVMDWRRFVNLDLENIRVANFEKHCTLRNEHSRIHASMGLPAHPSKLHPHAALHQSCEKGRGDCFLVSVKKTKARTNFFSGKVKK